MARRSFPPRRVGAKRNTDWVGSVPLTSMAALAASSVVLSQIFTPTGSGETVIRTRGLFGYSSDQVGATETQLGAIGIGVVSAQAVSVGVSAIPHPDTDASWDGWFWHSYFVSRIFFNSAIGFDGNMVQHITIDSKAMRKVGDEERVVVVVQNSAGVGMNFFDSVRILSKPF